MIRPLSLLLILSVLAGCTLIDQRTFNPDAGKVIRATPPPAPAGPQALITIDFSRPSPDYQTALRQAVDQAVARKPSVAFEVVTVVPGTGTVEEQVTAANGLTPEAREVARTISGQGVDDDRVTLSARAEGVKTRQVQVFVH